LENKFIASGSDGGKRVNQSKRISRHGGAMMGRKELYTIERFPFPSPLDESLLNRVRVGLLAAYLFSVIVERSFRVPFYSGFLRGLLLLNPLQEFLGLTVFVRLGTFSIVCHADSLPMVRNHNARY
jgi:hypothetical protein